MSNKIYECIGISGFDTSDISSGQFYDLSIISQRKKMEKCLFWMKTMLSTQSLGYMKNGHPESEHCNQ